MERPFTPEWAIALCAAINADASYRSLGKSWHWPVALVLKARPEYGYGSDVAMQLELDAGQCGGVRVLDPSQVTAPFVLTADYDSWKRVVMGELDVALGVTLGKITLRGAIMTLMMHVASARALVSCARAIPTEYPDERGSVARG